MPWVKIDDGFTEHRKFHQHGNLYPLLVALQVGALCHSARHLTDGYITEAQALALALPVARGHTVKDDNGDNDTMDPEFLVECMVDAGLWERNGSGYLLHDYGQYQPSREQVQQRRARTAERQRAWRSRNDVTNGATNGAQVPLVPGTGRGLGTYPESSEPTETYEGTVAEDPFAESASDPAVLYDRLTQRFPSQKVLDWLAQMERDHPVQWVSEEMLEAYKEDRNHLTLLGRTDRRLKARAYAQNKPRPQPAPEPEPPPTPEQEAAAAEKRRIVREWLAGGGLGGPPPEDA